MAAFGLSAFLKLVSMNDRPLRTEVKHRIVGRGDGGYDYHRNMKRLSRRLCNQGVSLDAVLAEADGISPVPERRDARLALQALSDWLDTQERTRLHFLPQTFSSGDGRFKVTFTSDVGLMIRGRATAIHIWNTASPILNARLAAMALDLFPSLYSACDHAPEDLAVLNLRNGQLVSLSNSRLAPNAGAMLATRISGIFESVEREIDERNEQRPRPDDHPGSAPG